MIQEQITTLTLPYPLGDKRVRVYVPPTRRAKPSLSST